MDVATLESKRKSIIALYLDGKSYSEIIQALSHLNVKKSFVTRTVSLYNKTGDIVTRKYGRKRTARSKEMIQKVKGLIEQNPCRTSGQLAAEVNISRVTMQRILLKELGLKSFKFKIAHNEFTPQQKQNRVDKAKELLRLHAIGILPNIVFSGVTSFPNPEQTKTDRVYLPKESVNLEFCMNSTMEASLAMVWAAVTTDGRSPLVFLDPKVKINSTIYREKILEGTLKPWAVKHFDSKSWTFQQDSAPYNIGHVNQEWFQRNIPYYMSLTEWLANSPDINPLHFAIWDILKRKIGAKKYQSVDILKSAIKLEWQSIPEDQIRAACNSFFDRLKVIVNTNGDYIDEM